MPGHVFILRTDLTRLFCDAWLIPTDYSLDIRPHWLKEISGFPTNWSPGIPPDAWRTGKFRVMEVKDWPTSEPKPWLVNTGGIEHTEPKWFAQGITEFFEKVAPIVKEKNRFAGGRIKPLLAIPMVGTGAGGGFERAGAILKELLPAIYDVDMENCGRITGGSYLREVPSCLSVSGESSMVYDNRIK